jgi:hypothetical protein
MLFLSIFILIVVVGVIYYLYKSSKQSTTYLSQETVEHINQHIPQPEYEEVPAKENLEQIQLDALATAQKTKEQVTGMIEQINAVLQEAPIQPVVEQKVDSKPKKKRKYYPRKK